MSLYYNSHTFDLRAELGRELPVAELKSLHQRRPLLHFLIAFGVLATLIGASWISASLDVWYLWLPFAALAGFAVFDFTVLLHEVVHKAVFSKQGVLLNRITGLLYAIPSGISASQFTQWHLDHHAELGSDIDDPKRHHLSPKRNERWFKLLYFTPVLFPIYFRAARKEVSTYPADRQKLIARERIVSILFHLSLLGSIAYFAGAAAAWKLYAVPVFFFFPVAFALNRLGQHYDIDPEDPAKWTTLVRGSWFWNVLFLNSNHHLEHHYFPGVPFYNLPRLQRALQPFYERHGFVSRTYGQLLWSYLVLNRKPHTKWESGEERVEGVAGAGIG